MHFFLPKSVLSVICRDLAFSANETPPNPEMQGCSVVFGTAVLIKQGDQVLAPAKLHRNSKRIHY